MSEPTTILVRSRSDEVAASVRAAEVLDGGGLVALPTETLFSLPAAFIPLERQLRFRRAWRLFRFGNVHAPGGASCHDWGGFLPPLR